MSILISFLITLSLSLHIRLDGRDDICFKKSLKKNENF